MFIPILDHVPLSFATVFARGRCNTQQNQMLGWWARAAVQFAEAKRGRPPDGVETI